MFRTVKRGMFAILSVTVILGSLAIVRAQEENGLKSEIFIPKMRHDYGRVFEQETYQYKFKVLNRGKADLVISNVKPG
jgi:hypothetical protein